MKRLLLAAMLVLPGGFAAPVEAVEQGNKTVVGPANVDLQDGTNALRAGDAETAIPLLERGLRLETSLRNVVAGLSNLCAAYALSGEFGKAIRACTMAIERNDKSWHAYNNRANAYIGAGRFAEAARDIEAGFRISPDAGKLRQTQRRLEYAMNPVVPTVIIDDRRLADPP